MVAATLFTVPHGLLMRTQNWVGEVMAGVTTAGALPPMGWVKSNTGPSYHWYMSDVPDTPTVSVVVAPLDTVPLFGCCVMPGAEQVETTFTATDCVFADPQALEACIQYFTDAVSGGVTSVALVAPATGFERSPLSPWYHCTVSGEVPSSSVKSVAGVPLTTLPPLGWSRTVTGVHGVTVTVTESLLAEAPQLLVTRTQNALVDCGVTDSVAPVPPATGEVVLPLVPLNH